MHSYCLLKVVNFVCCTSRRHGCVWVGFSRKLVTMPNCAMRRRHVAQKTHTFFGAICSAACVVYQFQFHFGEFKTIPWKMGEEVLCNVPWKKQLVRYILIIRLIRNYIASRRIRILVVHTSKRKKTSLPKHSILHSLL